MRHLLALAATVIPIASQAQADTGRLVGSQWMNGATIEVRRHGDDSVQVLARSIRGAAQATLSLTSAQRWVDSARALLGRDVPRPRLGELTTLEFAPGPLMVRRAVTPREEFHFLTFATPSGESRLELAVDAGNLSKLVTLVAASTRR